MQKRRSVGSDLPFAPGGDYMASKQTSISRPAARKGSSDTTRRRATGSTKPPKSAVVKRRTHTPEPEVEPTVAPPVFKTTRKFVEPPKVQGELPTPVATFVF